MIYLDHTSLLKHSPKIKKMLETLINQTLLPQEVILVNDCSSDGSEKAAKEIVKDQ